ncbi:MAG TPA: M20/M25/M40 family metallo-hydrolase [Rectinemataceae bacterium]|nr:M20/M25/M40 family metallo-hydrolase [Rectinemataceae bacterium]
MEKSPNFENVQELSILLARTSSVTDSSGEKAFPAFLLSILGQIPYFRNNPDSLEAMPIPGDPKERSNVFALVRGSGKRCVVLTGHYDVVQTSMYGSLEPWAFDPETLSRKMLESLAEVSGKDNPLSRLKEDLASGEFLPGRGILDMKSGLAAGISVLATFSSRAERKGNILFLSVADEEGSSHGMKAAAAVLKDYLDERGLEASAVFNLDSAVDQDNGEMGRAVFTGSVGKTLPFVYFVGKCTHAGAPFDGINPVLLASEFAREVECNPDAIKERQVAPGEEAPPPTILYFRESRTAYDVTTPSAVFCALNVLSHTRGPEEILDVMGKIAADAMNRAISSLRERASTLSRRVSGHFALPARQPQVVDFDELSRLAERLSPGILEKARVYAAGQQPDDRVQQTLLILQELLPFSGLEGPAAIMGFAPPYYARAEIDQERDMAFIAMLRSELSDFSRDIGKSIRVRPYFPGISDMSFLAPSDSADQRSFVKSQSPVADPGGGEERRAPIGCPVVNIGPWGREYHQIGERVHKEYSFIELPKLLTLLVRSALDLERMPESGKPGAQPRSAE